MSNSLLQIKLAKDCLVLREWLESGVVDQCMNEDELNALENVIAFAERDCYEKENNIRA